jgi:hypothetical protein
VRAMYSAYELSASPAARYSCSPIPRIGSEDLLRLLTAVLAQVRRAGRRPPGPLTGEKPPLPSVARQASP